MRDQWLFRNECCFLMCHLRYVCLRGASTARDYTRELRLQGHHPPEVCGHRLLWSDGAGMLLHQKMCAEWCVLTSSCQQWHLLHVKNKWSRLYFFENLSKMCLNIYQLNKLRTSGQPDSLMSWDKSKILGPDDQQIKERNIRSCGEAWHWWQVMLTCKVVCHELCIWHITFFTLTNIPPDDTPLP